ncbi:MAG: S4 domain-containing protein, partial [Proteobacteria bacterium]|nr:S4 domain-containing protein [Pseudomonadota bacterium]
MGELLETLAFDADIPAEMHGIRLDQAAVQLFSDYSRSKLQEWILDGSLTVDGETRRPKDKVSVGQQLTIRAQRLPEVIWSGEDRPLDILFEDEHIFVVNKPAGLVVHPAAGHTAGTL